MNTRKLFVMVAIAAIITLAVLTFFQRQSVIETMDPILDHSEIPDTTASDTDYVDSNVYRLDSLDKDSND